MLAPLPGPPPQTPRSGSSKLSRKTLQGRTDFQAFQLPPALLPGAVPKFLRHPRQSLQRTKFARVLPTRAPTGRNRNLRGRHVSPGTETRTRGGGRKAAKALRLPGGLRAALMGTPGPPARARPPARQSHRRPPHARARAPRRAGSTGAGSVQAAPPQRALCPEPGMAAARCPGPIPSWPPRL